MSITGITSSPAGNLIKKMKSENLKFLIHPDELELFDSELRKIFGWIDANCVIIAITGGCHNDQN